MPSWDAPAAEAPAASCGEALWSQATAEQSAGGFSVSGGWGQRPSSVDEPQERPGTLVISLGVHWADISRGQRRGS